MADPFLGMIILVPYNFAPLGWAFCNGQLMSIAQNTALFALIGTTFGGNGIQTFGLPDLRSRVPTGAGQGPGLSNYDLGQMSGSERVTLTIRELPAHTHVVTLSNLAADAAMAAGAISVTGTPSVAPTGNNQPFTVVQPYLTLNYCIALQGIFP